MKKKVIKRARKSVAGDKYIRKARKLAGDYKWLSFRWQCVESRDSVESPSRIYMWKKWLLATSSGANILLR